MDVYLNKLNKWVKRAIALISDTFAIVIALAGAIWLSGNNLILDVPLSSIMTIMSVQCGMYILFGLYRGIWRFASIPDLIRIVRTIVIGTCVNVIILRLNHIYIPTTIILLYFLLLLILLSGTRLFFRWYRDYSSFSKQGQRVLVVGAGSAGEGLIRDLYRSSLTHHYIPILFVDDNKARLGSEVHGIRVMGSCHKISALVKQFKIDLILIAIPSASSKQIRRIVSHCEKSNVPFRTLPSLKNITDGIVKISSLRSILLEDLLGREQVNHDLTHVHEMITDKTVLVTGGGGSIGSELCRQLIKFNPKNLIIVDNSEFNLYSIEHELKNQSQNNLIYPHLNTITDEIGMNDIFNLYHPEFVFHVAAYKHVPLLENHVRAAMHNNIIGTQIVAQLADKFHVKTFVLISTDKAVNPTNIMGATKRAAEIYCQTFNHHSKTRFLTVRFGNVLDSAGSVIPLFRKQLANGGPLTVTHPDISRYFMTIPEAAQLILQATSIEKDGEIFVLDMGEPINIRYLAEQMIKLSGKLIGHDIEIKYTGLRPGEKLHEELFHANEITHETHHPKIKQAYVRLYHWQKLLTLMEEIKLACDCHDEAQLITLLKSLVPEYHEKEHQEQQTEAHPHLRFPNKIIA